VRTGLAIMGLLGVLGACGEDPGLTCVNGYVLDGERCIFRDYVAGDFDAGVPEPVDAGSAGPADASPCDASMAHDETAQADAAPCSASDAAAQDDDAGE
jgi:hypothetical protein